VPSPLKDDSDLGFIPTLHLSVLAERGKILHYFQDTFPWKLPFPAFIDGKTSIRIFHHLHIDYFAI